MSITGNNYPSTENKDRKNDKTTMTTTASAAIATTAITTAMIHAWLPTV